MTFLITGASGFIGRHLGAELTARGHHVLALMRRPQTLPALQQTITALGGRGHLVDAIAGDLDQPGLGIRSPLPPLSAIIHLGARFAWGLDRDNARRTNTQGSLAVAELARQQGCRLVFISGFMLENQAHLARLGIAPDHPDNSRWQRVYQRAGGYEASKLEAALRVRQRAAEQDIELVEVQPATVAGHSHSGLLDPAQPLYSLIHNLAGGRLAMVPGSPAHWLPLVAVDTLSALIAQAALAKAPPSRLLALDPATPNLQGLLAMLADELGRRAPRQHVPLGLLAALLKLPGLATLMQTAPEALHFIHPTRFDTATSAAFMAQQGMAPAPIEQAIRASARHYLQQGAAGLRTA
ncbi:MAG: SDR family oxidoreductase [Alcanivorax sp.]|nr:SDR family oxidoreductase [Alcanivorax sp.]